MSELFQRIRQAVLEDRYLIGEHAAEQLEVRGVPDWQVVVGMEAATLLLERPSDEPHPAAEAEVLLADGTPVKAVWSYLRLSGTAKLVTVHFFDR